MKTGQGRGLDAAGNGESQPQDAEQEVVEHEVVLSAVREGRWWVVLAPEEGVLIHARTLRALAESAQNAVALRGGAPLAVVRVRPCSAELDALDEARARYEEALGTAVRSLRLKRVSWSDTAFACQVRAAEVRDAL